jgi:hypothetical protein
MPDKDLHIDKLFKEHLIGHKVKAPANAWDRLNDDLNKTKRVRPLYLWRSIAATILLLITFSAGYFFAEYQKKTGLPIASGEQIEKESPEITTPIEELADAPDILTKIDLSKENGIAQADLKTPANETAASVLPKTEETSVELPEETFPTDELILDQDELADIADETTDELQATDSDPKILDETLFTVEQTPSDIVFEDNPLLDAEALQKLLEADQDFAMDFNLSDEKQASSNWSIGARFSPVYSYRNLSGSDFQTTSGVVEKDYFDAAEAGIFTLSGGISLNYRFNDKWSLGSGMYVSRIGQINNEVLAYASADNSGMFKLATSSGAVVINPKKFESVLVQQQVSAKDTIAGGYIVLGDFVQNLDYLEVPFVMNYKISDNRLAINLMGGLSPGILVNNRSYFEKDGEKLQTGTTQNIDPVIYNSVLGIGLNYAISEKVSINLEPTFKYSLSPINSAGELNYHPYSFSWFTGVSYKFY